MITDDITTEESGLMNNVAALLLTGSGWTTCSCCSWRPFNTWLKSIASWACSIISLGGRLRPLQVSLPHRQTITCKMKWKSATLKASATSCLHNRLVLSLILWTGMDWTTQFISCVISYPHNVDIMLTTDRIVVFIVAWSSSAGHCWSPGTSSTDCWQRR